jgi:hypothetical protein
MFSHWIHIHNVTVYVGRHALLGSMWRCFCDKWRNCCWIVLLPIQFAGLRPDFMKLWVITHCWLLISPSDISLRITECSSRDSSVGIATGYGLDVWGSIPGKGKIFVFSTASKLALWSSQPPIQWVPGSFSWGWSVGGVKLTTHHLLVSRSRMVELYFHSLIRLHGMVFK